MHDGFSHDGFVHSFHTMLLSQVGIVVVVGVVVVVVVVVVQEPTGIQTPFSSWTIPAEHAQAGTHSYAGALHCGLGFVHEGCSQDGLVHSVQTILLSQVGIVVVVGVVVVVVVVVVHSFTLTHVPAI